MNFLIFDFHCFHCFQYFKPRLLLKFRHFRKILRELKQSRDFQRGSRNGLAVLPCQGDKNLPLAHSTLTQTLPL